MGKHSKKTPAKKIIRLERELKNEKDQNLILIKSIKIAEGEGFLRHNINWGGFYFEVLTKVVFYSEEEKVFILESLVIADKGV